MSDFTNKKGTEGYGSSMRQNCVFAWTSGEILAGKSPAEQDSYAVSPVVLESDIFSDAGK